MTPAEKAAETRKRLGPRKRLRTTGLVRHEFYGSRGSIRRKTLAPPTRDLR